jgi:RNA-binding protein
MLTSKQRAYLRALANPLDPIVIVGKDGVTENVAEQVRTALAARELIKGRVLDTALCSAREVSDELCARCDCEAVQCIGPASCSIAGTRKSRRSRSRRGKADGTAIAVFGGSFNPPHRGPF